MTKKRKIDAVPLGKLHAHVVDFDAALLAISSLCKAGRGGFVVTPNVDHVVLAERNAELVAAYHAAALSLVDGKPLVWLSHLMRRPLPEKISGSDLVRPLAASAALHGLSIFLLGARPGVAERAASVLTRENPDLEIAGVLAPPPGFEDSVREENKVLRAIRAAKPSIVLVALGAPKQEVWMHHHAEVLAPSVLIGIGATLDFLSGDVRRAPRWMSDSGLEWAFRLLQEPRRMAQRYLVRDRAFFRIAFRSVLRARPWHRHIGTSSRT